MPLPMDTRLLILNSDPVFQDRALAMFDAMCKVEIRIVRSLSEAVYILMREDFDLFVVEGEAAVAIEQAIHTRQHFPSLKIVCLGNDTVSAALLEQAGVACLSGTAFGDFGEGYLRFSVANSLENLNKALDNIERWVSQNIR